MKREFEGWFFELTLMQQLRVVYFIASFIVMGLAIFFAPFDIVIFAMINFSISIGMLNGIPLNKLK